MLRLVLSVDPKEATELYTREGAANSPISYLLTDVISTVADYDVPRFASIMTSLAESTNPEDRKLTLYHIHALTPVDRELGVRLWDQLVRDEDREVRDFAYRTLSEIFSGDDADDQDRHIEELGITWKDAFSLLFARTELLDGTGSTIHHIGSTTVGQAVEQPEDQV